MSRTLALSEPAESVYFQAQRRGSASPARRGSSSPSTPARRGSQTSAAITLRDLPPSAPEQLPASPRLDYEQEKKLLKRTLIAHSSEVWEKSLALGDLQRKISAIQLCLAHKQKIALLEADSASASTPAPPSPRLSLSPRSVQSQHGAGGRRPSPSPPMSPTTQHKKR